MALRLFVYEYLSGGGAGADASLRAAGLQMRDALLADLVALPAEPSLRDLALSYAGPAFAAATQAQVTVPRPDEAATDFVRRVAAQHDLAWVVAPETGGLLAQLCQVVGPRRWIGCRRDAIRLCASKRATLARLAAHGLTTPLALEDEATRWVVKPDDGAGSVDTRVHVRRREAESDWQRRSAGGAPATLEPWVEGLPLSLSLWCRDDDDVELLSINRQRIEVDPDGVLHEGGVTIHHLARSDARATALTACAQAVARAVGGLRGFVGIDLVWHPQRGPVVIEVNPRITAAYVGQSAARGRNLAAEILARCPGAAHD